MEHFLQKKPNNGTAIPTSGNTRNAPDPSSAPTSAGRNSQSSSTSGSSNNHFPCLSRPMASSASTSTLGVRPSILGARPSPTSASSGNSFASPFARNEEASSEFAPQQQQQRAPPQPPPAQQRPFLQLGEPSSTPRFGAHTAPSSTTSDPGNGLGGNTTRGALSGFGRFKSSFFGEAPSSGNGPAEAQAAPPAEVATSAATGGATNSGMSDLSANPGKAVSPHSMGGGGGGGGGVGGVSREGKAGGRGSLLGKISRTGSNAASRTPDADNHDSDATFEKDQDQGRDDPRTSEAATSFRRAGTSTPKHAEKLKTPGALPGKQQGASAPQQQKPPALTMLRRPSLARGGGTTEGSGDNRFDVGGGGREDNARSGNGGPGGGEERSGRGDIAPSRSGGPAGGEERSGMGDGEMGFRVEEAENEGMGRLAPPVSRPHAAPERSSAVTRPSAVAKSSMADGDDEHGPIAAQDACQRPDASSRNDIMGLLDHEADAEETRAKMAQREEWIRQKDAAMARFRRECKAEVDRVKSLMEEHVAELETLLDAELVDALDDTIGEKIEDNQREKTRARKVKSLVSAFFDDPRVPKAQRVMWYQVYLRRCYRSG